MTNFMDTYVDVAERIRILKQRYPEATLQPADPAKPYWIEDVPNVGLRLVYVAACYRTPTDTRPGIGMAWEPLPGLTPFTKGSELMVAETSAWGRAIVAALAADTQRIASADEVRNRTVVDEQPHVQRKPNTTTSTVSNVVSMPTKASKPSGSPASDPQRKYVRTLLKQTQNDDGLVQALCNGSTLDTLTGQQARKLIEDLLAIKNGTGVLTYDADGQAVVTHNG